MQIDIQARGFALTNALRKYTHKQLVVALAKYDDYFHKIIVRLSDINGPRGGEDKCCRIRIALNGMPAVMIQDTKADLYSAINSALERSKRTVIKKIDRKQTLLKH